jgi:uncharacterized protein (TIGR03435 family)
MMFHRLACGATVALSIMASVLEPRGIAESRYALQEPYDLAGTWQGTLGSGQEMRVVVQIAKGTRGEYRALFYNIDRSGDGIPVSEISVDGSTVKMAFTMVNGTFHGRFAPDGKSIVGTWSQNAPPVSLTLARVAPGSEWTIPPAPVKPTAMDPTANPAFEVATVKPSSPDEHRKFFRLSPDHLQAVNQTVDDLITFAYGVHRKQIVDAPSWMESEQFDISAKPDAEGMPSLVQWRSMVQKLLADRFKLSFHRDQRDLAVYTLYAGPSGAKLTESQGDPKGLPGIGFQRRVGDLSAFNVSMVDFLNFMTRNAGLDRPILDRTGLTGRYDFKLTWTPDDAQGSSMPPNEAPPLYTALQEQLGLKLSATKAPAEVYIVDHVEKPGGN